MKKQAIQFAKYGLMIVLIALSVFSVIPIFAPEFAESLLAFVGMGSSGMMVANTAIVGTQTFEETTTKSPNHVKRDVSQIVTEMRPDEFPLDTMLRNIRKAEKATHVKAELS